MSGPDGAAPGSAAAPRVVTALLGSVTAEPWASRRHEFVEVPWGDARKHRQIVETSTGREVALRLPRGTFLADGAVLADDGTTATVVRRPPEPAIVVPFGDGDRAAEVRRALLFGYLLGNRHAPLELSRDELRTPLLTGTESAARALSDLGVPGEVRSVPLAAHGWSMTSADHSETSADHSDHSDHAAHHRADHSGGSGRDHG